MKVFDLKLEFDLEKKPLWFESFRKKYNEPYNYHITLKYPTLVEEADISKLKSETQRLASASNAFIAEFNKYFFDKTSNGNLIMISAKHNKDLIRLQKNVVSKLNGFGETINLHYKDFETNFKPHIALARKLSDKMFLNARKQLKRSVYCKATITKLALTIVNKDYTINEVLNPENTLYYNLNNTPDRSS